MTLRLFNTLTRKKETFKPINPPQVGMYSCGPTVYWYAHVGNMRTYIFSDILKRVLLYNSYKVNHIINVTDVGHLTSDADEGEDKMEKAAKKEKKTAKEIAEHYFSVFKEDLDKLNILPPQKWTKATDYIQDQIELIQRLEKRGYTYQTDDGIYFDSLKFKDYGKLAKLNVEGLQAGKRIGLRDKKNKTDFALWKFSKPEEKRQQEWDSPWGKGFPGWHIECSAMSMRYLGETFDIHTGGEDHIPIHHTNEIAQSEGATGKKFVNYWLHGAFLINKERKKVSKSAGGLYIISELEKLGYLPLHYRYFCLLAHYRKPLVFSLEHLDAAKNAYEKLMRKILALKESPQDGKDLSSNYREAFHEAVNDDLNLPRALQVALKALEDNKFDSKHKLRLLYEFDSVLGLGFENIAEKSEEIPPEIMDLVEERETARKQKNWKKSDELRQIVADKGYSIEDSPQGARVRKS